MSSLEKTVHYLKKSRSRIRHTLSCEFIDVNRNFMIWFKFKQTVVFFTLACLRKNEFEVFTKISKYVWPKYKEVFKKLKTVNYKYKKE